MKPLMTAFALASALTLMTSMGTLAATFVPISSPDAAYLAATNYIDPSAIPDGSFVSSISDGTQTVHFKTPDGSATYGVQKFTAPGGDWGTWSQAPDSQRGASDTLPVFYSNDATMLRFGLATPVNIFGFEAEPNAFAVHTMVAKFYDASNNLLGTISRNVHGMQARACSRRSRMYPLPTWCSVRMSTGQWAHFATALRVHPSFPSRARCC